jgi:hypothetical protein
MTIPRLLTPLLAALLTLAVSAAQLCAQISVISNSVAERQAVPDESYEGTLLVRNDTDAPQDIKIYKTDYRFFADGRSLFAPPGTTARSNASWVTVSQSRLSIPPRQTVAVGYRVAVPNAAADSLVGSFWSMIMVEGMATESPESPRHAGANARVQMGVKAVVRYGTQVVTHIGGSGAPKIEFAAPKVALARDGGRQLAVDILNVGDRAHRLDITLELVDERGTSVAKVSSKRGLVYPGTSIRQQFDLGRLRPGAYTALVVTDAGDESLFGAQYALRF